MSSNDFTVDVDELADQLAECSELKDGVSEANGDLRSRIKAIIESSEYHKNAFAMVRQIFEMSETKRADFLRTFKPMFDGMYQQVWLDEMKDLVDKAEAETAAMEDELEDELA